MIIPPYLKPGDTIALTCPAGYMPAENAAACVAILQEEGYHVVIGNTVGSNSQNYFSGTDDVRLQELQRFLDAKKVHAILCARGGYGTTRIIDLLDFKPFCKQPKWIIGFSDITVLHAHLFTNLNIASLHAPMAGAFKDGNDKFTETLLAALRGEKSKYQIEPVADNRFGRAKGKLIGGNLALLTHLCGTNSDINTKNCLLFLEDVGEYLYSIDRMLYQFKTHRKLQKIRGLIIGGFSELKDTPRPFGKDIQQIFRDLVNEFDFPVCFNFPVSHEKENVALKIGVKYELLVNEQGATLTEC